MSGVKLDFDDHLDTTPEHVVGYKRLAAAICIQAADDAERARGVYRVWIGRAKARVKPDTMCESARLGFTAERWFTSKSVAPYSFQWCCDLLGVNAEAIRSRVCLGEKVIADLQSCYGIMLARSRNPGELEERLEGVA
jgi:hypothetical protein